MGQSPGSASQKRSWDLTDATQRYTLVQLRERVEAGTRGLRFAKLDRLAEVCDASTRLFYAVRELRRRLALHGFATKPFAMRGGCRSSARQSAGERRDRSLRGLGPRARQTVVETVVAAPILFERA